MEFVDIFGEKLLTKEGEKDTTEVLAGKSHVMVYFSSHWCPPCRKYTPALSDAWEKSANKGEVAIIFVSSDRDQAAFDEYWGSMSFHALPYSLRDKKKQLWTQFRVTGIPTVVLLDGKGKLKEDDVLGRHDEILSDGFRATATKSAVPFVNLFGEKLLTTEGEKDTTKVLAGKSHVMIYFSSHWCPQSLLYTPALSKAYEKSTKKGEVAIIFVSSDRDQAAFDDYWGSMPFHALPYSERDQKDQLCTQFRVKSTPKLVLLDSKGNLKHGDLFGSHDLVLSKNTCCCIA